MPYFSGRIDAIVGEEPIDDELTMIDYFILIVEEFDCSDFVFCFEDTDKTKKLARKPHYHFFYNTDISHDKQRRFITSLGFAGSLACLKKIEEDKPYHKLVDNIIFIGKCCPYTMKHGNIVFTDIETPILKELVRMATQYQEELPRAHLKKDIVELIYDECVERLQKNIDREEIVDIIFKTYYNVNYDEKTELYETFGKSQLLPTGTELLKLIYHLESRLCTFQEARRRYIVDNTKLLNLEVDNFNKDKIALYNFKYN